MMTNHSEKITENKKDFDRNCSISGKKDFDRNCSISSKKSSKL